MYCTKVKLFQEHTRDLVRRQFPLLVTARVGGTTGQAATGSGYGGGPGCCRCPRLTRIGATITVVPTENNKMLNASGGLLEWVDVPYTHYLHVGLWCGPSAL